MTIALRQIAPLMILLALGSPALAANLASEGRRNAQLECSACHQVTSQQNPPPPVYDPDEAREVAAPPFDVIAKRYAGRKGALRAFIQAPRHPMREQQFTSRDLTAITAYIGSLHHQRWTDRFDRPQSHDDRPR